MTAKPTLRDLTECELKLAQTFQRAAYVRDYLEVARIYRYQAAHVGDNIELLLELSNNIQALAQEIKERKGRAN